MDLARHRLGKCAVGVIDQWDRSCPVLNHQLPWLNLNCTIIENNHKTKTITQPGNIQTYPFFPLSSFVLFRICFVFPILFSHHTRTIHFLYVHVALYVTYDTQIWLCLRLYDNITHIYVYLYMNLYIGKSFPVHETHDSLPKELVDEIVSLNKDDMLLYEEALNILSRSSDH